MNTRAGLLGGSFNPVHTGHLELAEAARDVMALDRVVLMPAAEAPHKDCGGYARAADRLAMCGLAAKSRPYIEVSDFEIRRGGKSYTIDTMRGLRESCPDTSWTLILGSDMLLSFTKWRSWREILTMAGLCAAARGEDSLSSLEEAARTLREEVPGAEITVLPDSILPVSSTQIRQKFQSGEPAGGLVPESVAEYIRKNGLYGA